MNQTEVLPKNHTQVAEALRKGAATNKAVHAMCLVFAVRERTRFQVNVGPVRLTLAQEGYHFSIKEIEDALTFFASLGVGKLHFDNKKRIKGLVEIRWTLQSIGKAALGEAATVARADRQRRYANLPGTMQQKTQEPVAAAPAPLKAAPPVEPALPTKHQVFLTATIGGREVQFPLPMRLTSDELVELIAELNEAGGVTAKKQLTTKDH